METTCTYENAQFFLVTLVWFYWCFYTNISAEKGQLCRGLICLQPKILELKEIMQFVMFKTQVKFEAYRRNVKLSLVDGLERQSQYKAGRKKQATIS